MNGHMSFDERVPDSVPAAPPTAPAGERLLVPVALRWADMDAYAHVNNVEIIRCVRRCSR